MGLRLSLIAGALAAGAATAQAQPAQQTVDRIQQTVERAVQRAVERADRALSRAYQGRSGPEQTERFSRRIKIGRDGRFSIINLAGNIVVTGGSGDEVSIDAVKRTRGGSGELASVRIDVDDRPGRVDVRTTHTPRNGNDRVSVDYTIVVPTGVAVEARSVSGRPHGTKRTGIRPRRDHQRQRHDGRHTEARAAQVGVRERRSVRRRRRRRLVRVEHQRGHSGARAESEGASTSRR